MFFVKNYYTQFSLFKPQLLFLLLSDWLDVKISWKKFLKGVEEILLNSCSPALVRVAAYSAVARVAKAAVKHTILKMRTCLVSILFMNKCSINSTAFSLVSCLA